MGRLSIGTLLLAVVSAVHADAGRIMVAPGDTLWSIARSTRTSSAVSIRDQALAIFRSNPHAFRDGTMDSLVSGGELIIPETDRSGTSGGEQGAGGSCRGNCAQGGPDIQESPTSGRVSVQVIRGTHMAPTSVRN